MLNKSLHIAKINHDNKKYNYLLFKTTFEFENKWS